MTKPSRPQPPVIIYLGSDEHGHAWPVCTADLLSCGLRVVQCTSIAGLESRLGASSSAVCQPAIIVVDGHVSDSFRHTAAVRVLYPDIGIVVLCDMSDPGHVLAHMHAGADVWCPSDASSTILAAQVFRLIWRLQRTLPVHGNALVSRGQGQPLVPESEHLPPQHGQSVPPWVVTDHGWTIWTPNGRSITLTPSERAFLCTLWQAADGRATHAALLAAIQGIRGDAESASRPRLGVIVSRLRRKVSTTGAVLPMQSIHNWGYTLTASFIDGHTCDSTQQPA